jgi:DNA polymerase-3 subunit gamma/tau
MLSNSAFNALLKTLEEPPAHVVFIFATTEIHKIPATILSRCQHYNFRRIARAEIIERLRHVAEQDQLTIEERSFLALARASEGSMRDALSLLDQAIAFGGKTIHHPDLEALLGAVPHELVQGIVKAVMIQDSSAALTVLANLLDQGHDLRAFCDNVVEQIRNLLVASVVPSTAELRSLIEASEEDIKQLATDAKTLTPEQLQELLTLFIQAEDSLRLSAHPRFVLETAAIRATRLLRRRDTGDPRPLQAAPAPTGQKSPVRSEAIDSRSAASSTTPSVATSTPSGRTDPAASQPQSRPAPLSQPKLGERPVPQRPPDQPTPKESAATLIAATAQSVTGQATLNWEAIQNEIAASFPNIAPFLEAGRFLGIEGGLVTIGFAKHATLARTRLEKEEHLLALATLCQEQSGTPVRIRIVELAETDPPGPTMAQVRAAKEQDQRLVLFERARANPTVKHAIEIFGAELTEVRRVAQKEATE